MTRVETNRICYVCKKVFCCEQCRERHENTKHTKRQPNCPFCFSEKLPLKSIEDKILLCHIAVSHLPLHCSLCGEIFKNTEDLQSFGPCKWTKRNDRHSLVSEKSLATPSSTLEGKESSEFSDNYVSLTSPPELTRNTSTPVVFGLKTSFNFKTPSVTSSFSLKTLQIDSASSKKDPTSTDLQGTNSKCDSSGSNYISLPSSINQEETPFRSLPSNRSKEELPRSNSIKFGIMKNKDRDSPDERRTDNHDMEDMDLTNVENQVPNSQVYSEEKSSLKKVRFSDEFEEPTRYSDQYENYSKSKSIFNINETEEYFEANDTMPIIDQTLDVSHGEVFEDMKKENCSPNEDNAINIKKEDDNADVNITKDIKIEYDNLDKDVAHNMKKEENDNLDKDVTQNMKEENDNPDKKVTQNMREENDNPDKDVTQNMKKENYNPEMDITIDTIQIENLNLDVDNARNINKENHKPDENILRNIKKETHTSEKDIEIDAKIEDLNPNQDKCKNIEKDDHSRSNVNDDQKSSSNPTPSSRVLMMVVVENNSTVSTSEMIDTGLKNLERMASFSSPPVNINSFGSSHSTPPGDNSNNYSSAFSQNYHTPSSESSGTSNKDLNASSNSNNDSSNTSGIFSAVANAVKIVMKNLSEASKNLGMSSVSPSQESVSSSFTSDTFNSVSNFASSFLQRPAKRPRDDIETPPALRKQELSVAQLEARSPLAKRHRAGWYKIKAREPIARMRNSRQLASPRGISSETQVFHQGSLLVGDTVLPLPDRAHQSTQTD